MSSAIPEDAHREITKAVMTFAKGKQGEEREALRKDVSSVSLPALYRNVTSSSITSRLIFLNTRTVPSPFINTRSLRFGLSQIQADTDGMGSKFMNNESRIDHTDFDRAQKLFDAITVETIILSDQGKPLPKPLQQKVVIAGFTRSASILSILIESMPNLQLLETSRWTVFYFAKLKSVPESGARFSRPLSGLSSLRILKIGNSGLSEMSATNCIWLMLFLPNLTHLKAYIELHSKDEEFFRDHQEVLVGKSKVTHLDIQLWLKEDEKRGWTSLLTPETEILERLLSVTKGLVELKLCNIAYPVPRSTLIPSLLFLRSLRRSFSTLKYLYLIGDFTERLGGSEAEDRRRKPPVSIDLKSLEMVSLDLLSIRTFGRAEENSRVTLTFPSLEISHLNVGQDWEGSFSNHPTNISLMDWIKSKSFPTTIKKVILNEKPLDVIGTVIDLGEKKVKWEKERAELLSLCRKKKLEVKILKVGEQLPFGVMPEPEDL